LCTKFQDCRFALFRKTYHNEEIGLTIPPPTNKAEVCGFDMKRKFTIYVSDRKIEEATMEWTNSRKSSCYLRNHRDRRIALRWLLWEWAATLREGRD
jgi:hypothetical protein